MTIFDGCCDASNRYAYGRTIKAIANCCSCIGFIVGAALFGMTYPGYDAYANDEAQVSPTFGPTVGLTLSLCTCFIPCIIAVICHCIFPAQQETNRLQQPLAPEQELPRRDLT